MTDIERVALALNAELKRQWNGTPAPGREWDPTSWTSSGGTIDLEAMARVAIAAMREPTPEFTGITG